MGILSTLFGSAIGAGPPEGKLSTADGFIDIDLPIVDVSFKPLLLVSLVARGRIQGTTVGFALDLDPEWVEKPLQSGSASLYLGKARVRSIGPDSDAFAKLLSTLYQMPCPASKMPSSIAVEVVGLADDPRHLRAKPTKMKVFFNSGSKRDYAEAFINVDLNTKVLEFHEKDLGYRAPLLRAMCGEG